MGLSKTQLFTPVQNRIAALAKAIGHPARIAILQYLIGHNGCVCGEIVDALPLSQSTISQHLKALKEAGLIQGNISGVRTCYCINEDVWKEAKVMLQSVFIDLENCC
ncbi:MAG: metalloregulator ArsR/SmtB family transcription factor [Bacteroidota bacterium]